MARGPMQQQAVFCASFHLTFHLTLAAIAAESGAWTVTMAADDSVGGDLLVAVTTSNLEVLLVMTIAQDVATVPFAGLGISPAMPEGFDASAVATLRRKPLVELAATLDASVHGPAQAAAAEMAVDVSAE